MRKQVFSRQHFVRECSGMLMCLKHLRTPAGRLPVFEHHRCFRVSILFQNAHVLVASENLNAWSAVVKYQASNLLSCIETRQCRAVACVVLQCQSPADVARAGRVSNCSGRATVSRPTGCSAWMEGMCAAIWHCSINSCTKFELACAAGDARGGVVGGDFSSMQRQMSGRAGAVHLMMQLHSLETSMCDSSLPVCLSVCAFVCAREKNKSKSERQSVSA